MDQISEPIVHNLVLFCQLAGFNCYVINHFIYVSTKPTLAILLSIKIFLFSLNESYGVALCCY